MIDLIVRIDGRVTAFLRRWSITLLRVSVAIVFIWFGALKVFDVTPVTDLVGSTVYWVDPDWFVPIHGEYRHLVLHAQLAMQLGMSANNAFVLEDGDVLVLDCRTGPSYREGHVPGALSLPPRRLEALRRTSELESLPVRRTLYPDRSRAGHAPPSPLPTRNPS